MSAITFKVKHHHTDGDNCLDVFVTVGEVKKRYFARFEGGGWYTVYPSGGYWEPNSRVGDNVVFEIVGKKGGRKVYYTESNGVPATFVSFKDKANEIVDKISDKNPGIKTWDEWREWMAETQAQHDDKDYLDNWCYGGSEVVAEVILYSYKHLGVQFEVVVEHMKHRISNDEYSCFYISHPKQDDNFRPIEKLIGYMFFPNSAQKGA